MVTKLPPVNDPALKPWARKIEDLVLGHQTAINGVNSALARNSQQVGGLVDAVSDTSNKVTQIPKAPNSLQGAAVWAWAETGNISVTLNISWDAVTRDLNDGVLTNPIYEVWVRSTATDDPAKRVNATKDTSLHLPGLFTLTADYYVSVRAVTERGSAGQFSGEVFIEHPSPADLPQLEAPSAPTLTSAFGAVAAHWDGKSESDQPIPSYFAHVVAGVSNAENGDYTFVGQQLQREGNIVAPDQPVGDVVWVKLFAMDYLGRFSIGSVASSIEVQGVDLGTLGDDLEAAQAAVAQAQIDVQAAQQSIADMQGEISDATRLTTGTLDPGRIGPRTITADKVIIADLTNHIADPTFFYRTAQWTLPSNSSVVTITDPPTGSAATTALQVVANGTTLDTVPATSIPVRPGEKWYAEMWIRRIGAMVATTGTIQLGATVTRPAANGGTLQTTFADRTPADITTTWQRISGIVTIPDFGTALVVRPSVRSDVANGTFQMTEVVLRRMVAGELLVDGTITGSKIAANAITAAQMQANSISSEVIAAGAVTAEKLAVGAVTAEAISSGTIQSNHIAAGSIQVSHLEAGIGGALDISANDSITLAVGMATDAQATANAASSDVEDMRTVYDFGATGATISSPNTPFSLALMADRIEMQANGAAVSTWTAGQMTVESFVGTEVVLGNHKIEKYGTGTVVRAL
jgi:hypothetical protein